MSATVSLALIDFSGTLSLGSVLFSRTEHLSSALHKAGLTDAGVTAALFWTEIIGPGWQIGSTTALGYSRLLADGALRLAASRGEQPEEEQICAAALRFTAGYFCRSRIAAQWAPILSRLARRKKVVIATDHYAEATAHIVNNLSRFGLEAAPAAQARPGQIMVANSADLGYLKESPLFWVKLKSILKEPGIDQVSLVDDFGFNEQPTDSYGGADKVAARRLATVAAIGSVWCAPMELFPFFLPRLQDYPALVAEAGNFLLNKEPSFRFRDKLY